MKVVLLVQPHLPALRFAALTHKAAEVCGGVCVCVCVVARWGRGGGIVKDVGDLRASL